VCWTGFGTGGHYFYTNLFALPYRLVYAVKTKGAFLNHAMHPMRKRPDPSILTGRRKVRAVVLIFLWLLIVETPDPIRTGNNTILAAYAPPEILYHNPILTAIGCLCWTHDNTWGIVTVHAQHRYKVNAYCWVFTVANGDYLMPEKRSPLCMLLR